MRQTNAALPSHLKQEAISLSAVKIVNKDRPVIVQTQRTNELSLLRQQSCSGPTPHLCETSPKWLITTLTVLVSVVISVEMYICRDIIGTLGSYHTQKLWQHQVWQHQTMTAPKTMTSLAHLVLRCTYAETSLAHLVHIIHKKYDSNLRLNCLRLLSSYDKLDKLVKLWQACQVCQACQACQVWQALSSMTSLPSLVKLDKPVKLWQQSWYTQLRLSPSITWMLYKIQIQHVCATEFKQNIWQFLNLHSYTIAM